MQVKREAVAGGSAQQRSEPRQYEIAPLGGPEAPAHDLIPADEKPHRHAGSAIDAITIAAQLFRPILILENVEQRR